MTKYWDKQMEHEGTRSYYETLKDIVAEIKPEDVLEWGLGWGISASAFLECSSVKHLTSIDPNLGSDYGILAKAEVLKKQMPGQQLYFIDQRSEEYLPILIKERKRFDLVYIDGDHQYEAVIRDLNFAIQLIKPGGKIILDDFLHAKNMYLPKYKDQYGIYQAVREFLLKSGLTATIRPNKTNGFVII